MVKGICRGVKEVEEVGYSEKEKWSREGVSEWKQGSLGRREVIKEGKWHVAKIWRRYLGRDI